MRLLLGVFSGVPALVYASVALWGLAFGGTSTLLQSAVAEAAGDAGDVAQALLTTGWNVGIAGGGIIGGLVLSGLNASWLSWVTLALLVPALATVLAAHQYGFTKGELGRH